MSNRKYIFENIRMENYSRSQAREYLNNNVFKTADFAQHVESVAVNLNVDKTIIRDVLVSYWTNIFYLINTIRKVKTKINVYGFFSLIVEKGNRF